MGDVSSGIPIEVSTIVALERFSILKHHCIAHGSTLEGAPHNNFLIRLGKYMLLVSVPAGPIWRGGPPLLPSSAAPLPFLSCILSYFNSRHKTLHFGEKFMKIRPKFKKKKSMFKGGFYMYSIFEVFSVEWDYIL